MGGGGKLMCQDSRAQNILTWMPHATSSHSVCHTTCEGTVRTAILYRYNIHHLCSWRFASGGNWKEEFVETEGSPEYTITNTQAFTEYEIKVQSSNNEGPGPEPESITTFSGQDSEFHPMIVFMNVVMFPTDLCAMPFRLFGAENVSALSPPTCNWI